MCSVAQACLALCNPMDFSPLGSSVHEIIWTRILESVAIPHAGMEPMSVVSPAFSDGFFISVPPGKPLVFFFIGNVIFIFLLGCSGS